MSKLYYVGEVGTNDKVSSIKYATVNSNSINEENFVKVYKLLKEYNFYLLILLTSG